MAGHLDEAYYLVPGDHSSIQWGELLNTFNVGDGRWWPNVSELLELAAMYLRLKVDYLDRFSLETDPIKFNLYRLVNRALNATYRRDLVKYERHCLRVHSPFVLNLLLTHRPLFVATLALLDGLTEDNSVFTFMKLQALYRDQFELDIGKDLTDPFFEHIWSWMFTGTVDASASSSSSSSFFFIDPHIGSPSPTPPHLNMAKFPVGVLEPRHGQTIYSIGKLVGELKANGRLNRTSAANQQPDCSTLRTELWRRHYANRQELYASSGCFRRFLAEVKAFVLENVLQVETAVQEFLEFLALLQAFYLLEDEHFWTSYSLLTRKEGAHEPKYFKQALRDVYGEVVANAGPDGHSLDLLKVTRVTAATVIDVRPPEKKCSSSSSLSSSPPLRLSIEPGPLVNIFEPERTLHFYQTIFGHLYPLHATRTALTAAWKEKKAMEEVERKRRMMAKKMEWLNELTEEEAAAAAASPSEAKKNYLLLYRLLNTVTTLLTFSRSVVRLKVGRFEKEVADLLGGRPSHHLVETIQRRHRKCLHSILELLFLSNRLFTSLQKELLQLCDELLLLQQWSSATNGEKNNNNDDKRFKRADAIEEAYRKFFTENVNHIEHFGELLLPLVPELLSCGDPLFNHKLR